MDGSIAAVCASVGHRNPGASSVVPAQPPTRSRRSRTSGFRPALARNAAATRPLWPPPMMIASRMERHPLPGVPENALRRVSSGRAHDAAAGMRGGSAHPEIPDRRLILRPARRRTQEKELLERQLALENVALRQPELTLDVE